MRARTLSHIAVMLASFGCANRTVAPAHSPLPTSGAAWSFDAILDESGRELHVEATFAPTAIDEGTRLSVTEGAEPFIRNVRSSAGPVSVRNDAWFAPGCSRGCTIAYDFALGEARESSRNDDIASGAKDVIQSPPGAWLLRPLMARETDRFRVVVRAKEPHAFASGMRTDDPNRAVYMGRAMALGRAPYSLFGKLEKRTVQVGASTAVLAIGPGERAATEDMFAQWVERSGRIVADAFGKFPIDGTLIGVLPLRGTRIGFGRAMASETGGSILVDVGHGVDEQMLRDDWVLVHEMIHLAFPSLDRRHRWMEEGLATYLEPLLRARAGLLTDASVWHHFATMMDNGLPRAGDRGLDRTPTWGRVYWGGALFCLVADVEIRRRTNGARSLDDALRAILAAGGDNGHTWPIERAFAVGDSATGERVLSNLYGSWKNEPTTVDLAQLFRDLGVRVTGETARLDDGAPLAGVRRQMTGHSRAALASQETILE